MVQKLIEQLAAEYNQIYENHPMKWANSYRDKFAFEVLGSYGNRSSFLDIGCGNGHTIDYFHTKWPEIKYVGVDLSKEAIRLAKERCPYAEFVVGDILSSIPELLRIRPSYSRITIMGVVEHFDDPGETLKAIRPLLALKGLMYVEAPNCLQLDPDKTEGFRRTYEPKGTGLQEEWHLKRDTWETIIRDAGYIIERSVQGMSSETEFVWILRK